MISWATQVNVRNVDHEVICILLLMQSKKQRLNVNLNKFNRIIFNLDLSQGLEVYAHTLFSGDRDKIGSLEPSLVTLRSTLSIVIMSCFLDF